MDKEKPLLEVRNLCKFFPIQGKGFSKKITNYVKAVNDLSFDVYRNETLGIVGESGCGKTTVARSILRAIDPTSGSVQFNNGETSCDLAKLSHKELTSMRTQIQMVFQDPFASLNPRLTVGSIIREPLDIHNIGSTSERESKVDEILSLVGLKPEHKLRYPHAFSGGQRQRVGIARALILNPSFIVADEAVSALDVSVQAQVINLLAEMKEKMHLSMIFVAHDLSVVRHICDRVAVMYLGKIVELAPAKELFNNPRHPYTRLLLGSVPSPNPDEKMQFIEGEVADAGAPPDGCSFNPRCGECEQTCKEKVPNLIEETKDHFVACLKRT